MTECQSYRDRLGITHCFMPIGGSSLCISTRAALPADPDDSLEGTPMSDPNAQYPEGPRSPYQPAAPAAAPLSESDDRQWASLAHIGGILGVVPSLLIWLIFKDRGRFTAVEAKEALNFQITLLFGYVAINIVAGVLGVLTFGLLSGLSGLVWVLWLVGSVFSVLGFRQAKDGHGYRYPFAIRLIT